MKTEAATLDVFEVLHGVGDVNVGGLDVELVHRTVKDAAGGADEGDALFVFLVAGLLADEHETRAAGACARDDLRSVLVKIASFTARHRGIEDREFVLGRNEGSGGGELDAGGHASLLW
jgi:hypothetical protein